MKPALHIQIATGPVSVFRRDARGGSGNEASQCMLASSSVYAETINDLIY